MIHEQAIVDPGAKLAADVRVGPWTYIGPGVEIGPGTIVESHVVIKGPTVIGANNHIYQFSTVGEATPDLKYRDEPTRLVIGDHNVIRENVTIHRGTVQDRAETTIGNHNLIMAYVHIGHDCVLGDHIIMVNNAALAGHVHVGDWAILSGYTLVHQFCKIGAHSFSGMATGIGKDVPAFVTVSGQPAEAKTINVEGLRRRGFSNETLSQLRRAFKIIYRQGLTLELALQRLETMLRDTPEVQMLIDSIRASERGIVR
ncbi:acyl-ACP--UDP-N-acetylglucosamine O-acyltransferase [Parahaliea aestuarii]|uniref:Acyl-[acyl-carrier-protein]--UDP-N-acetylglucosamine O-acyltransferase n=1 Tax=Parahaliea aestuarii TaxID=1852021 RepID=A0A5C8ZQS6_9GAMM|nr:acyl-ACP--UDP-N-acetylglucosamine O-acyltransferase [Parahaliea aestuarii]TXS89691.1 acyl-ACP--UDP-N-acetylglucosamine O-acyltransferase [Parahaliea aestuarii]